MTILHRITCQMANLKTYLFLNLFFRIPLVGFVYTLNINILIRICKNDSPLAADRAMNTHLLTTWQWLQARLV